MVSNWEPAHSLVEDAVSGAKIGAAPSLLAQSPACLSASGEGEGPVCSQLALLWCLFHPLFCDRAMLCVRAFFSSLVIPQFGLLSHLNSLRLSSGHSGLVLTLSTNYAAHASLSSPCLLVVDASLWATSPLTAVVRCMFCFVFLFFVFFFQLCCHLRFQNSSQTRLSEVSYTSETSPPSRLPPQDGSLSLTLLCLLLSFIFCPTSFQREWAVFRDAWSPLPAFRSFFFFVFVFFCGSCSAFR